ncbi:MAG TPA: DUF4340 domain-containing protein [Terracidiphilus sp.]|nr:DUF4340 domain-containing protein [Terracidiphilus sp.]
MKFRGLAIACAVLLALSGLLYWSSHHKSEKKVSANASPVILKVDPASVTSLSIHQFDGPPVTLARTPAGAWQITAPQTLPANQQTVKDMLSALAPLDAERVIANSGADLQNYGLSTPSVEIDITEKNHAEQKLLFGDKTPTGDSAYAMVAGDPRVFTTYLFHKSDLNKSVNDLRDTRMVTADPDKMSRIDLVRGKDEIDFDRNSHGNWQIEKPGPYRADTVSVDGLADALSGVHMNLTGEGSQNADAGFAKGAPVATARISAPVGAQTLEIRKNGDHYYAKSSVAPGAYLIDSTIADSLKKSVDDYRNKTVFDFSYNEPDEINLQITGSNGATQSWNLRRGGNDWWLNGKKMDPDSVENVISSLRDLTATKFATTGFTRPEIEATVASSRGSVAEKVSIAKSGNDYLAQRANEPTLYVLDAGAIEGLESAAKAIKPAQKSK